MKLYIWLVNLEYIIGVALAVADNPEQARELIIASWKKEDDWHLTKEDIAKPPDKELELPAGYSNFYYG